MNDELKNRLSSLGWRVGMMVLAVVIDWLIANETALNVPVQYTVLFGLILGEISKAVKNQTK
jgi:hypothetical protein